MAALEVSLKSSAKDYSLSRSPFQPTFLIFSMIHIGSSADYSPHGQVGRPAASVTDFVDPRGYAYLTIPGFLFFDPWAHTDTRSYWDKRRIYLGGSYGSGVPGLIGGYFCNDAM